MLKQRTMYLDVAKGIGIILVVLGHMYQFFPYGGRVNSIIASVHMPLFLVISGYCVTVKAEESPSGFITKKFDRLIKPYFAFAVLSLLLYWPENAARTSAYVSGIFFANGISAHIDFNTPLWYLPFCFMGTCIFYWILRLSERFSDVRKRIAAELLLTLAAIGLGYAIRHHYQRLPWSAELALMVQGLYLFGHWCKLLEGKIEKKWFGILIPAAFLLWVFGVKTNSFVDINAASFGSMHLFYMTAVAGVFLLLALAKGLAHVPVVQSVLSLCGKNSLYIMAFHIPTAMFAQDVVLGYMPKLIQQNFGCKNIIGISYQLICSIAVCLFVALLCKKTEKPRT
ncbi:MAG: acyltransferase family protein [Hungatella sp.]